jgi:hypothetical protein
MFYVFARKRSENIKHKARSNFDAPSKLANFTEKAWLLWLQYHRLEKSMSLQTDS